MISDTTQLFHRGLQEVYFIETNLPKTMQEIAQTSQNEQFKKILEEHERETEGHVQRLEQVFSIMGRSPELLPPHEFEGLQLDRSTVMDEVSDEEIKEKVNIAAALKTEHMEIGFYEDLINLAHELKIPMVIKLLRENLREEEKALEKIHSLVQMPAARAA